MFSQTNQHGTGFSIASQVAVFLHKNLNIIAPAVVFVLFFSAGSMMYRNFFTLRVFLNLFTDNSYLGIAAVGMTVVIISGGIDLSVGSIVSTTAMIIAVMTQAQLGPAVFLPVALLFGTTLGLMMGLVIHYFDAPPFIVTLAGMFFARGFGYVLSLSSVPIRSALLSDLSGVAITLPGRARLTLLAIVFLFMLTLTYHMLRRTKFGRTVYAIGGGEESAFLMGLPVVRTKILIYTFSGFCAGIAGIVYSLYTLSGFGLAVLGLELEAIAAVVIGGTLLSGGYGSVIGTFVGVAIQGLIQTIVAFEGASVYWTRIITGALLFAFIVLQRLFVSQSLE